MSEASGIQSLARAFALLELLCKQGETGVTDLSLASGLPKATTFRLLGTLSSLGYVRKNTHTEKYGITLKFLKISAVQLSQFDLRNKLRPYLNRLSELCGETVHLIERNNNEIIYIDKIEAESNTFRMASHIGLSLPMLYTAAGKVILSNLADSEIKKVWDDSVITARTSHTITHFEDFMKEIAVVRKNGYAIDNEENETGVKCVSTAIADIFGVYRYAVSVSAPANRMTSEKISLIHGLFDELKANIS